MPSTFQSGRNSHNLTVYSETTDGKRYPAIVFVHGNAGLSGSSGEQIHKFAEEVSTKGYTTAVPNLYLNNDSHLTDTRTKEKILHDAIEKSADLPP